MRKRAVDLGKALKQRFAAAITGVKSFCRRKLFGLHEGDTRGSNFRRFFSRMALVLALAILGETVWNQMAGSLAVKHTAVSLAAPVFSVVFFMLVVVWVIFASTQKFRPDPARLIVDIFISTAFSIVTFAWLYRYLGIIDTADAGATLGPLDHLYFAMVTFSTLGYGDFRPSELARLPAALQALIGNLHLGLAAGAAYHLIQSRGNDG